MNAFEPEKCYKSAHHPSATVVRMGERLSQEDRFVSGLLPPLSEEQLRTGFLTDLTESITEKIRHVRSGSTYTAAAVAENCNIVTYHMGDSPAILVVCDQDGSNVKLHPLTRDLHTPSFTRKELLTNARGRAEDDKGNQWWEQDGYLYKYPRNAAIPRGIRVKRAVGDTEYEPYMRHDPEVGTHRLSDYCKEGQRAFLMVATDGILFTRKDEKGNYIEVPWDEQLFALPKLISSAMREDNDHPAAAIATTIARRLDKDNTTVSVSEIIPGRSFVSAVFDGHGGKKTSEAVAAKFHKALAAVQNEHGIHPDIQCYQRSRTRIMPGEFNEIYRDLEAKEREYFMPYDYFFLKKLKHIRHLRPGEGDDVTPSRWARIQNHPMVERAQNNEALLNVLNSQDDKSYNALMDETRRFIADLRQHAAQVKQK